jgi:hypothetical protein
MDSLWSFLAKPKNQKTLSWLGGGVVIVAGGIWAVMTFLWPAHEAPKAVCAQQGVAVGGNVSGSTVTNTATGSSSSGPCVAPKDAK